MFPFRRLGEPFYGAGISIIIPVCGPARIPFIRPILDNLSAQNYDPYEVIISEYGLSGERFYQDIPCDTYRYTIGGEIFNKSKTLNRGFLAAHHEICMLLDADIILPRGYLTRIDNLMVGRDFCSTLKRLLHVDLETLSHDAPDIKCIRDDYFVGGVFAIRRQAYMDIGGMCEEFEGYGFEDTEFWSRVIDLLRGWNIRDTDVLHIDHHREYCETYERNKKLWNALIAEHPRARAERFRSKLLLTP